MKASSTRRRWVFSGALLAVVFTVDSIGITILVNVLTGGTMPDGLNGYRRWVSPALIVFTLIGIAIAVANVLWAARREDTSEPTQTVHVRISNLRPRNQFFTGRSEILEMLRRELLSDHTIAVIAQPWHRGKAGPPLQALHGMPGVGKTELVQEYAHRFNSSYDIVWWVDAERSIEIPAQLARLGTSLGMPSPEPAERHAAVLSELNRRDRWLIVFDNAREPGEIERFQPSSPRGHVIITSRYRAWRSAAHAIPVDVFSADEARDYLIARIPGADLDDITRLAQSLGRLPLALAQASAYIEQRGLTLQQYLELYENHQSELLQRGRADGYPHTVSSTFELAFREIGAKSQEAQQLLYLYSFLAPDKIPVDLASCAAQIMPEPLASAARDRLAMAEAIGLLHCYSLAERSGDYVRVHRLVQQIARDQLTLDEQRAWMARALQAVECGIKAGDARADLVSHLVQLADRQLRSYD